jgi:hypothetical protein
VAGAVARAAALRCERHRAPGARMMGEPLATDNDMLEYA